MSGFATRVQGSIPLNIPAEPQAKDFCPCNYRCAFSELAFAGSGDYKGDKASFIFQKIAPADTITFKILKNGVEKATITDNTYGTYYSSFAAQPLYTGFIADWTLIQAAFGNGFYSIKTETTILGTSYETESHQYDVKLFNEKLAYKTVKIESYQTGELLNGFDFRNLVEGGWYSSMRLPGDFVMQGEIESERYSNSRFEKKQNRDKVIATYDVQFRLIPEEVHDRLVRYEALANYLRLSKYDIMSNKEIRNVEVYCSNIGEYDAKENGTGLFSMELKERKENIIKRNVN